MCEIQQFLQGGKITVLFFSLVVARFFSPMVMVMVMSKENRPNFDCDTKCYKLKCYLTFKRDKDFN